MLYKVNKIYKKRKSNNKMNNKKKVQVKTMINNKMKKVYR